MPRTLQQLTVFVAWPGDVSKERDLVFKVVGRIDRTLGKQFGIHVRAVDWKTVARSGQGRPQARINEAVQGYDIFVGILNLSIGSDAGKGLTGFEEEFALADEAWRKGKKGKGPSLLLYFRSRVTVSTDSLRPEQVARVQAFKPERIKRKTLLFGEYRSLADFEEKIHDALYDEIAARMGRMTGGKTPPPPAPAPKPSETEPPTTRRPQTTSGGEERSAKKRPRGPKALPIEKVRPLLTDAKRDAYARRVFNSLFQSISRTAATFDREHAHATSKTTRDGADAFEVKGQVDGHAAVHFRIEAAKDRWDRSWQIRFQEAVGSGYGGTPYYQTITTIQTADDDYVPRLEGDWTLAQGQGGTSLTASSVAAAFWSRMNAALKVRL